MQPVLSLIEHDAALVVDAFLGAFLAVVSRQVMHEHAAFTQVAEPFRRDRVACERRAAALGLSFLPHGYPYVGIQGVGTLDGFARLLDDAYVGAVRRGPPPHLSVS